MLSRTAESFYWIGRYTERIDYTARLVDVNLYAHHSLQDDENHSADLQYRLNPVLKDVSNEQKQEITSEPIKIVNYLTFDRTNVNSINNCLDWARNNVREVRQYATSRMWDSINAFYMWFQEQKVELNRAKQPFLLFERVRREVSLFQSIANRSMLHEVEWGYMHAGVLLERSENSIRMIQLFLASIIGRKGKIPVYDANRLNTLLESIDGFEAFRRTHGHNLTLERVLEFLLLNSVFPGSVYSSLYELEEHLKNMKIEFQLDGLSKVIRTINRLRALIFQSLDLSGKSLEQHKDFLECIQVGCDQIGQDIEKSLTFDREGDLSENLPRKLAEMV